MSCFNRLERIREKNLSCKTGRMLGESQGVGVGGHWDGEGDTSVGKEGRQAWGVGA